MDHPAYYPGTVFGLACTKSSDFRRFNSPDYHFSNCNFCQIIKIWRPPYLNYVAQRVPTSLGLLMVASESNFTSSSHFSDFTRHTRHFLEQHFWPVQSKFGNTIPTGVNPIRASGAVSQLNLASVM